MLDMENIIVVESHDSNRRGFRVTVRHSRSAVSALWLGGRPTPAESLRTALYNARQTSYNALRGTIC